MRHDQADEADHPRDGRRRTNAEGCSSDDVAPRGTQIEPKRARRVIAQCQPIEFASAAQQQRHTQQHQRPCQPDVHHAAIGE